MQNILNKMPNQFFSNIRFNRRIRVFSISSDGFAMYSLLYLSDTGFGKISVFRGC
jgi:hypothetical protein